MKQRVVSVDAARRIALAAQGFGRPRPKGRVGAAHLRRLIHKLGLLQIDYVNVLVPSQYLVPFSRLGPYDRAILDRLVYKQREFTEQWAREASIVPVDAWRLLRHRMAEEDRRGRFFATFVAKHPEYVGRVLDEVRARGPVTAGDIAEPDGSRGIRSKFWGWTMAKRALESHFGRGHLAIADRRGRDFARSYDLPERVLAAEHLADAVDRATAGRELVRRAARAHGIGTAADLADYYRMPIREAHLRIGELVSAGELHHVRVEGWREPAYLDPSAARPRRIGACALLSPFDPVVWHRARVKRLFEFDYILEIWVPREKRRWGYYVLPFLLDDRLVARVDLKADRAAKRLLVISAYVESGVPVTRVAEALAGELRTLARWLALEAVWVGGRTPFGRRLRAALATAG